MSEMTENDKTPSIQSKEDVFWPQQHAEIEARALSAFARGAVGQGRAAAELAELRARRKANSYIIHLDPADASQARQLAEKKGLEYEAFLRNLFHEAIQRELALTEG